ncbi:MAG TPA: M20/M25/M40 family metallo-hydrolase [Polyangia bacterium]|jgi:acetylornithine deacetylase|nr:M20/M25/M40 family metallo-hydrolase [Polyangia bacterium]
MSLVDRLAELVSFDTQNPMGDERPLLAKLSADLQALGASTVDVQTVGENRGYVYARFGGETPRLLLNAHVDTVPANSGYSSQPHQLVVRDGRLQGLGTADTKGAIAAILETLEALAGGRARGQQPSQPFGVLFSGDEEKGGTCIRAFLDSATARGLERAIVCEPTGCRVGWRHRGIGAAEAVATGPGGHSSLVDGLDNPIAILARAAVALDEMGIAARAQGPEGFPGICLNVAGISGGIAFNVIPTQATLMLSVRPAPGTAVAAVLAEAERRARRATAPHPITWKVQADRPGFQTRDLAGFEPLLGDPVRRPVDLGFWTEAALLSERGIDAVVFGPGDVGQAHAADEHVTLADLEIAQAAFMRALT